MTIAEITAAMIAYSRGNLHDINHFLKVHAYARTIGCLEALAADTQFILEAAAIVHDIACPLCREKYGDASGRHQEAESLPLVRDFFAASDLGAGQIERIALLVSHHHTPRAVEGIDFQILLEADYLVNADESALSANNIQNTLTHIFKTSAGSALLKSVYRLPQ